MKIAISGKGGVGKTTLSSLLAGTLALRERAVIAVDADPDANLGSGLGLAPDEDIPEIYARRIGSVRLLTLGGVKKGGAGCICPASALIKALLTHLVIGQDDVVIMDMEAGIEHLGRATAQSMDAMVVVVTESPWSEQTALRVQTLAGDIGVRRLLAVANRVTDTTDLDAIRGQLGEIPLIGQIAYDPALMQGVLDHGPGGAISARPAMQRQMPAVEAILESLAQYT
jgi:CO dehydrogenase maturation factor